MGLQRTACSVQRAACSVKRAVCIVQSAECRVARTLSWHILLNHTINLHRGRTLHIEAIHENESISTDFSSEI
jgi:hypothetical protein